MRPLLACWRLLRVLLHGVHGLLLVLLAFPWLKAAQRQPHIAWWSAKLLRVLGMRLQVKGQFSPGATLVVANHVSWLDIMAVHALCPRARFVSKADVQRWPVLNRLVSAAGTLYIERERRRDALRVVHQMAQALKDGDTVAVFPKARRVRAGPCCPFMPICCRRPSPPTRRSSRWPCATPMPTTP
jgi:1-acyl-sn-glycerol-3-phosphate acyltransferase